MSRFDEDDDIRPRTTRLDSEQREYGWSWVRQSTAEGPLAHQELAHQEPAPQKHLVARACMLVLGGVCLVAAAAVTTALAAAFGQPGLIAGCGLCAVMLYLLCRKA